MRRFPSFTSVLLEASWDLTNRSIRCWILQLRRRRSRIRPVHCVMVSSPWMSQCRCTYQCAISPMASKKHSVVQGAAFVDFTAWVLGVESVLWFFVHLRRGVKFSLPTAWWYHPPWMWQCRCTSQRVISRMDFGFLWVLAGRAFRGLHSLGLGGLDPLFGFRSFARYLTLRVGVGDAIFSGFDSPRWTTHPI